MELGYFDCRRMSKVKVTNAQLLMPILAMQFPPFVHSRKDNGKSSSGMSLRISAAIHAPNLSQPKVHNSLYAMPAVNVSGKRKTFSQPE